MGTRLDDGFKAAAFEAVESFKTSTPFGTSTSAAPGGCAPDLPNVTRSPSQEKGEDSSSKETGGEPPDGDEKSEQPSLEDNDDDSKEQAENDINKETDVETPFCDENTGQPSLEDTDAEGASAKSTEPQEPADR